MYDFVTARVGGIGVRERPFIGLTGMVVFLGFSLAAFALYAPLAYGNQWTKKECERVKLFKTWDWDCNNFFDNVSHNIQHPS